MATHQPKAPESNFERVSTEIYHLVNALDKSLRAARQVDPDECDPIAVLEPIADLSLDIYDICDPHGGVYKFPLTERVLAWYSYVSVHPELLQKEGAAMDFRFYDQPDYPKDDEPLRNARRKEEDQAALDEGGRVSEKGKGKEVEEGDWVDDGDPYEDDDDWVEEEGGEGYDDEVPEEDAMDVDGARHHKPLQKRKSSDPIPYGALKNAAKRTRKDTESDGAGSVDNDIGPLSIMRDEPSIPTLIKYPLRCERCVQSNIVCYIPQYPQAGRTCDWCRRVKKNCSYLQPDWVSKLSAAQTKCLKAAITEAISVAPLRTKQRKGKGKLKKEDVDDRGEVATVTAKKGGQKSKATDGANGRGRSLGGLTTRSKTRDSEVRPFPSPQSPTIPTIYSLRGDKIDLPTILKGLSTNLRVPETQKERASSTATASSGRQPSPHTVPSPSNSTNELTVAAAHNTRASSSCTASSSRQPSPNVVPPPPTSERSVHEISELFERATALDGSLADVHGQLRALHRHADEGDATRQEVESLKRNHQSLQDELERFRTTTEEKMEATTEMVRAVDNRTQLNIFQATAEKQFERYEEDRRSWDKLAGENDNAFQSIRTQLSGVETQLESVRREVTERDRLRSDGEVGSAGLIQLLRSVEGYFQKQNDAFSERFDILEQKLNALGIMVNQQASAAHGYHPAVADTRSLISNTVTPKAVFPPPAPNTTHFSAEVPRIMSSPAGPHSFVRDSGMMWNSAITGSDLDRQFTNYSAAGSSTSRRSVRSGMGSGVDFSSVATTSDMGAQDASLSGSIQIPMNWGGGGKTGRRPPEVDLTHSHSSPQDSSTKVSAHGAGANL